MLETNCIPTSMLRLSLASGLAGCAELDKTEHGQIVTLKDAD
jgi:hypothetical protein